MVNCISLSAGSERHAKKVCLPRCTAGFGIDIEGKWVHRRLRSLSLEGIIICVDRGQASVSEARKAAQFRWAWTMNDLPGNAAAGLLDGL